MNKVQAIKPIQFTTLNERLQHEASMRQQKQKQQGKDKNKSFSKILADIIGCMIVGMILAMGFIYGVDHCTTTKVPVVQQEVK